MRQRRTWRRHHHTGHEGKYNPRAIVDKYHELLKHNMADLGISFDIYHRTSDPLHHETAREFFSSLNDRGLLEKKGNGTIF